MNTGKRWTPGSVIAGLLLCALSVWAIWPSGQPAGESTMKLDPDRTAVFLCIDRPTLDRLVNAGSRRDLAEIDRMVSNHSARPVKPGSSVRILDAGILASQVQVISGPDKGATGWVQTEILKAE